MSKAANLTDSSYDEPDHHFLPQLGFGSDVTFETIVGYHRYTYLFRVYTPKLLPAVQDESIFFVGSQFDNRFAPQTPITSEMHNYPSSGDPLLETATYEDCIQHLSWETRSRSPFISTTFSFAWAFWDALRRFETGVKHDVEIAVIDAASLSGKAVTTLQLLRKSPSLASKRHPHHWRWCRFAQESQSVLIHGSVPRSAVLASIPLRDVIQNLPSYFLKTPSSFQNNRPFVDPSLDLLLAWDFTNRKHTNFRRFCQEMGDRYTRMPYQKRVREIAIGSVRLALILLNPWFHRTVEDGDVQSAVGRIRDLSALVAHWPQQPGSRDFPEMASLMKALIQLLAEEVRGSNTRTRQTVAGEVLRLQQIVDSLLEIVHINDAGTIPLGVQPSDQQTETDSSKSESDSDSMPAPSNSELSVFPSHPDRPPRSELKIRIPGSLTSVASSSSSYSSLSSAAPLTPASSIESNEKLFTSPSPTKISFSHVNPNPPSPNFSSSSTAPLELSPLPSPLILPQSPNSPLTPLRISIPLNLPSPMVSSGPASSLYYSALKSPPVDFFFEEIEECQDSSESSSKRYWYSVPGYSSEDDSEEDQSSEATTLHDVVSYAVTGFLVGTFVTLLILSSQRRTMLYLT